MNRNANENIEIDFRANGSQVEYFVLQTAIRNNPIQ